ncbi:hypothetical protein BDY21DRAFT_218354 [Lineolata rhizophorae]|uniref:Uncharacterized protein n=1 Tax=Lineolata rhizophorae TaxID=578093 RepID=A0A6A6P2V6_9PEZI|nr:hypothetical protein BDY21DRAFT_218354 [Lineolata rhizophorae]
MRLGSHGARIARTSYLEQSLQKNSSSPPLATAKPSRAERAGPTTRNDPADASSPPLQLAAVAPERDTLAGKEAAHASLSGPVPYVLAPVQYRAASRPQLKGSMPQDEQARSPSFASPPKRSESNKHFGDLVRKEYVQTALFRGAHENRGRQRAALSSSYAGVPHP